MEFKKITLTAARVNAGLTLREAAERLGIAVSTLQSYEKGITFPNTERIDAMCELYDMPYDFIFFGNKSGLTGFSERMQKA